MILDELNLYQVITSLKITLTRPKTHICVKNDMKCESKQNTGRTKDKIPFLGQGHKMMKYYNGSSGSVKQYIRITCLDLRIN